MVRHPVPDNPFSGTVAADLYAAGRPFYHPRAIRRIQKIVGDAPINRALDVACGSGLSTVAIADIAAEVIGLDTAAEMVAVAAHRSGVQYLVARAEEMPLEPDCFDAVTVASGVHWFDQERFYKEANRVIRPDGWLAVYDHYFGGEILGDSTFARWTTERYLSKLPTPARGPRFDPGTFMPDGFVHLGGDNFEDPIKLSHASLINYLLTQSNCIAALSAGRLSLPDLRQWLRLETRQFFPRASSKRAFRFHGTINCLRSIKPSGITLATLRT